MARGILYVMSTIVPGLIKIGKTGTDNYKNRMYSLEHNGYCNVAGLKRRFAIEVDDYSEKEQLLDNLFSKSRVGETELFSVDIELVVQLMSALDGEVVYPKNKNKSEIFDEALENAEKEAEAASEENAAEDDEEKRNSSAAEQAKIDYWKRFYNIFHSNEEAVKIFGDPSNRIDNIHSYTSFAIGYGSDCRLDVVHRTRNNRIILQIWCLTDRYYSTLVDNRAVIDKAVSTYKPTIEWDEADSPKQSRHVNITFPHTSDTEADFNKVINTMIMLRETIQEVLG